MSTAEPAIFIPGADKPCTMGRFERFWETMCQYSHFIWLGVMVSLFLFILTIISLVMARPGTASLIVAQMNVVLIGVTGGLMFGMYWKCVKRAKEGY